jgi:hypothetical protein
MTKFTSQFSYIINTNECVPESVEWLSACVEKSNTYIITSLALLLLEIIWYNALKICLVVVVVWVVIKIDKSRNNNGPNSQHISKPTRQINSKNGEEPVNIKSQSSTSRPKTIQRRETTKRPTNSRLANSLRTTVSFTRGDDQGEDHQR